MKEERAMLLEEWLSMESSFGELGDVSMVQAMLPKKLQKRRQIASDNGLSTGYVPVNCSCFFLLLGYSNYFVVLMILPIY